MMASLRTERLRLDAFAELGAGGERISGKIRQQRRDARAPGDGVGGDVPDELGMLERCQDAVGLNLIGRCHGRLVLGRRRGRTPQRSSVFDYASGRS